MTVRHLLKTLDERVCYWRRHYKNGTQQNLFSPMCNLRRIHISLYTQAKSPPLKKILGRPEPLVKALTAVLTTSPKDLKTLYSCLPSVINRRYISLYFFLFFLVAWAIKVKGNVLAAREVNLQVCISEYLLQRTILIIQDRNHVY